MPKPDYSTWLTKAQAADSIGVSTKTVEKLADEKKLQQAEWKRPEGGPRIAVYHPTDVERLRNERNPGAPPFVMPAAADEKPSDESTTRAVAIRQPATEQFMHALAAAVGSSQSSENRVRLAERLYLTVRESSEFTGLGSAYLHRLIDAGKLKPLKGAGPHGADLLRRADLAKL